MTTTFALLGAPPFITRALERRGITEPFDIQIATIRDGLAGRDVCGRAPTGSGKTLAFGVPLIARTDQHGRSAPHRPRALVLAPTRELAEQITAELRSFSGRVRVDAVYGGVGYGPQLTALRRGVDVVVACPGRLEDLIERGDVTLADVDHVVVDEADRMADMGFLPAVRRILDQTAGDRQTVLFSATLDDDVAKLTRDYQRDPVRHEVGDSTPNIKAAEHRFVKLERMARNDAVAEVINGAWPSIVFTRTRHGADRLAMQLGKLGFEAAAIHGGRSQSQRNRALDGFAGGGVHALVATDVAARGIHVDGVASVIHYDPPEDHKAYTHRSGRTARAGAEGLDVSMVQPEQVRDTHTLIRTLDLAAEILDWQAGERPAVATVEPVARRTERRDERPVEQRERRNGPDAGRNDRRPRRRRQTAGRRRY